MSNFSIAFLLCFCAGIVATVLSDAAWGVYLYELINFLNPTTRWWYGDLPDFSYSFLISVCTLFTFMKEKGRYVENRLFAVPQTKWLLALTVLMFFVYFIAVWPEEHWYRFVEHVKLLAIIMVLYKVIDTPKKHEWLVWVFLTGIFYIGWIGHSIGRTGYGRLEAIGPIDGNNANDTAAVLICAVPIIVFYLLRGRNWQRLLSLIYIAYILDCIILINSRGAFVGLAVSMAFMSCCVTFTKLKEKKTRIRFFGIMVLALLLFIYLADTTFWERISSISDNSEAAGGQTRIFFWAKAFELTFEHPFGLGASGFNYLSPQILPPELLARNVGSRAIHCTYVQVLSEYGFLGIFLFGGYLASTIFLLKRIRDYSKRHDNSDVFYQGLSMVTAYVAFLVASVFIDRFYSLFIHWIPALIASFYNIYIIKGHSMSQNEPTK